MSRDTLTKRLAALEDKMTPKPYRKVYLCSARDGHVDEDVDAYFAGLGIERPKDDSDDLTIVDVIVLVPAKATKLTKPASKVD